MSENVEATHKIKNMLTELATHLDKKGAMCTNFVLVAEWVDSNGDFWLSTHGDEGIPPWRVEGLLSYALSQVSEDFALEEEDDGDEDF
jgi:hypothetical protein